MPGSTDKLGSSSTSHADNSETVPASIAEIMSELWFVCGYSEALKGRPFSDDLDRCAADAWAYERGRLFGVLVRVRFPELARGPIFTHDGKPKAAALAICERGFFSYPPALI